MRSGTEYKTVTFSYSIRIPRNTSRTINHRISALRGQYPFRIPPYTILRFSPGMKLFFIAVTFYMSRTSTSSFFFIAIKLYFQTCSIFKPIDDTKFFPNRLKSSKGIDRKVCFSVSHLYGVLRLFSSLLYP